MSEGSLTSAVGEHETLTPSQLALSLRILEKLDMLPHHLQRNQHEDVLGRTCFPH